MTSKTRCKCLASALPLAVAVGAVWADARHSGPTKGSKITTDQEQISWDDGQVVLNKHLADLEKDCHFKIPFEVYYAGPMKEWLRGAWGMEFWPGCQNKPAGCMSVFDYCAEIADDIAYDCRNLDSRIEDAGKDPPRSIGQAIIQSKIKRVVCKAGHVLPHLRPGPGQSFDQYSRMRGSYDSKSGTLTWTLHQSDNNRTESWQNVAHLNVYPADYRSGYPVSEGPHPDVQDD